MAQFSYICCILLSFCLLRNNDSLVGAYSSHNPESRISVSRRSALMTAFGVMVAPSSALAAPDCFQDCMKNCKLIAPQDPDYCLANCKGYCEQDDRSDGLSGSVGSSAGEVGILGGTFGQGTVAKGDDKVSSRTLFLYLSKTFLLKSHHLPFCTYSHRL
jgi:hypothetical protein